jgi:hypothetical protein
MRTKEGFAIVALLALGACGSSSPAPDGSSGSAGSDGGRSDGAGGGGGATMDGGRGGAGGAGGAPTDSGAAAGGATGAGGSADGGSDQTDAGVDQGTGAGDSGADAGAGGAGGDGGLNTYSCTPGVSPAMPLLTDFSPATWVVASAKWGTPGNLTGFVFTFETTATQLTSAVVGESLQLTGMVGRGDYGGTGLVFDECVNTTTYTGFQFTVTGTTGGCDLEFVVQTFEQQSTTQRGGCDFPAGVCFEFPSKTIQPGPAPITVRFTDLAGTGKPATAAAIAAEMVGLEWQLNAPSPTATCTGVSLTIDDVRFVSD